MKIYKEIVIAISIIIIIILLQIFVFKSQNEYQATNSTNELLENLKIEEEKGIEEEKTYSMQNGGAFAKIGDIIIYNNSTDNIYKYNCSDKSFELLYTSTDGVSKLYFDGEHVYTMPNYYRGKGIYKIDLQGNAEKIYDGASIQLWLTDDKVYFTDQIGYDSLNGTPQGNLCVMNKDGSNKQKIIDNVKNYFKICNDKIYYTDLNSRSIYSANIDGTNKVELAQGRNFIKNVDANCLTYVDFSDNEAYRIIYLENNENHELGKFGSDKFSEYGNYVFTRKSIDGTNLENEYSLYKINNENNTENMIWKSEKTLQTLEYIDSQFAYFTSGSISYRLDLNSKELTELPNKYYYFLNGYAYAFSSINGEVTGVEKCNLKSLRVEKTEL